MADWDDDEAYEADRGQILRLLDTVRAQLDEYEHEVGGLQSDAFNRGMGPDDLWGAQHNLETILSELRKKVVSLDMAAEGLPRYAGDVLAEIDLQRRRAGLMINQVLTAQREVRIRLGPSGRAHDRRRLAVKFAPPPGAHAIYK